MSKLKAKDPKAAEPSKPKIVLSGIYKVGKTWFALGFPNVYYIDTEKGADRDHYTDRLKAGGGVYMGPEDGTLDPDVIIDQFKALATEKHPYKTVVVDSITKIYNTLIAKEQERLGDKDAFGASKKLAISFMRRLVMWTTRLDMNIIFIAHEKAEWGLDSSGQRVEIGKTADVWEKLPYELELWLHASKRGNSRVLTVRGSRLKGFPEGDVFPMEYAEFASRFGKDIVEKSTAPIVLASEEQVAEIKRLVDLLKIDSETQAKWLEKANAENFSEFNTDQAAKIIEALNKKLTK
jgi:hypothetical protein